MAKKLPAYFIAVDVESSGIIRPGTEKPGQKPSQCISIALLVIDTHTMAEVDSYYSTIRFDPTRFDWSQQAEAIHGLSQQTLSTAPDMATVARQVKAIVDRWLPPQEAKLFAAHNPSFDMDFTVQVLAEIGETMRFIHRALDAFSYGFATFGLENSDDQFAFLGVDRSGVHNALDDIRLSIAMLREVRKAGELYRKQKALPPAGTPVNAQAFMAEYMRRKAANGDFRGLGVHDLSNNPFEKHEYVWVYYAGMGEVRYEAVEAAFIPVMKDMLANGTLKQGKFHHRPMVNGHEEVFAYVETNFPTYND